VTAGARQTSSAERTLGSVFGCLDAAAVRYAVLRGAQEGGADNDIDVLVAVEHLEKAARALRGTGFLGLPGWSSPTGQVLLSYDREVDRWIRVDLTTVLTFGRDRRIELDARGCLDRAISVAGSWRLAPADEFWALQLHDALDHRDGPARHAARVVALGAEASADDPIVRRARGRPGWDLEALLEAGRAGRIDKVRDLLEVGRQASAIRWVRTWARLPGQIRRSLRRAVQRARRRLPVFVLDTRTTNAPGVVAALPRALRPRLIDAPAGTMPVRALAYRFRGDLVLLATTGMVARPTVRLSPMVAVAAVETDAARRSAMAQIWDACTTAWSRQGAAR
jgi:hypothetical protein